jgi:hypothetical protein
MIDVNKLRSAANGAHVTFGDGGGVVVSAYDLTALLDMLEAAQKDSARLIWLASQHWLEPEACFRLDINDVECDAGRYISELRAEIDKRL